VVDASQEELAAMAAGELAAGLGRDDRHIAALAVREPRATFSLAPGEPPRPQAVTPVHGLFLAGDWTDTGLPATIEGAVLSGHRAAALVAAMRPAESPR
jgi:uncharacterized protein with NAD-binding domain and iron-sulfur cluster